jgi:hypothetical protein
MGPALNTGVRSEAEHKGWTQSEAAQWDSYWSEVRAMLANASGASKPAAAPVKQSEQFCKWNINFKPSRRCFPW